MPTSLQRILNTPQTAIGKGKVGEPPQDPPGQEGVIIRAAVFFDGTLNNRTNTNKRISQPGILKVTPDGEGSSYGNYYSNVAILEYMNLKKEPTKHEVSVYIEGIGTTDFSEEKKKAGVADAENGVDDTPGKSFGTGDTGIPAKVTKGINKLKKEIKRAYNDQDQYIKQLIIDVFGFSRGAAAARHFVSRRNALRGPWKNQQGRPLELIINFVGLFETVSSFDDGTMAGNVTQNLTEGTFEDDVKELGLAMHGIPKRVVHLTAADEIRNNFSLTTITTSLRAKVGFELSLPGVHSDVGGGYVERGQGALNKEVRRIRDEEEKSRLIAEGWYTDGTNGTKNQFVPTYESMKVFGYSATLWEDGVRFLTTEYQYVPLYLMLGLATKKGGAGEHRAMEFEDLDLAKNAGYRVPKPLLSLRDYFADYVRANAQRTNSQVMKYRSTAERKMVRNQYLHRSHRSPSEGPIVYLANKPTSDDTRVIIDDSKIAEKAIAAPAEKGWDWTADKAEQGWKWTTGKPGQAKEAAKGATKGAAQRVRDALSKK